MPQRWRRVAAWAVGILLVTSVPGRAVPGVGGLPGIDKLIHAGMYFGLARALALAIGASTPAMTLTAVAVFAAADEWHQRLVPGRQAEVADWGADMVGAAAGVAGFRARGRREKVRES